MKKLLAVVVSLGVLLSTTISLSQGLVEAQEVLKAAIIPGIPRGAGLFLDNGPKNDTTWLYQNMNGFSSKRVGPVQYVITWKMLVLKAERDKLIAAIRDLHARGISVTVKIQTNLGFHKDYRYGYTQATPQYVLNMDVDYYESTPGVKEPLPWDPTYLLEFEKTLRVLNTAFVLANVKPDAMLIQVGGSYGEAYMEGYEWSRDFPSYEAYYDQLMFAEKSLIAMYVRRFPTIKKILLVSHMYGWTWPETTAMEERNDIPIAYAKSLGVNIAQFNGGPTYLLQDTWGKYNLSMVTRLIKKHGFTVFLEDTAGAEVYKYSLTKRLAQLKQIETQKGIRIYSISLSMLDLSDPGLATFINYLRRP